MPTSDTPTQTSSNEEKKVVSLRLTVAAELARHKVIDNICAVLLAEANVLQERAKNIRTQVHRLRQLKTNDRAENKPG